MEEDKSLLEAWASALERQAKRGKSLRSVTGLHQVERGPARDLPDRLPAYKPEPVIYATPTGVEQKFSRPFCNRKVLIILDHGAIDFDTLYLYQYFAERGAEITFARPGGGTALLFDDRAPSHRIPVTLKLEDVIKDLFAYDAVLIPGSRAGSNSLRRVTSLSAAVSDFVLHGGPLRLFAALGDGADVLKGTQFDRSRKFLENVKVSGVESAMWQEKDWETFNWVKSTSSYNSWKTKVKKRDASPYVAYQSQTVKPSRSFGILSIPRLRAMRTASVVIGGGSETAPAVVTAAGKVWAELDENTPGTYTEEGYVEYEKGAFPLNDYSNWWSGTGDGPQALERDAVADSLMKSEVDEEGRFRPPAHESVELQYTVAESQLPWRNSLSAGEFSRPGLRVAVAVPDGAEYSSVALLSEELEAAGAEVHLAVPESQAAGGALLYTEPLAVPRLVTDTTDVLTANGVRDEETWMPNVLVIPPGDMAARTLRNDAEFLKLVENVLDNGGMVAAIGSGVEVAARAVQDEQFYMSAVDKSRRQVIDEYGQNPVPDENVWATESTVWTGGSWEAIAEYDPYIQKRKIITQDGKDLTGILRAIMRFG
jgi:putative intracellular protease/amidase